MQLRPRAPGNGKVLYAIYFLSQVSNIIMFTILLNRCNLLQFADSRFTSIRQGYDEVRGCSRSATRSGRPRCGSSTTGPPFDLFGMRCSCGVLTPSNWCCQEKPLLQSLLAYQSPLPAALAAVVRISQPLPIPWGIHNIEWSMVEASKRVAYFLTFV